MHERRARFTINIPLGCFALALVILNCNDSTASPEQSPLILPAVPHTLRIEAPAPAPHTVLQPSTSAVPRCKWMRCAHHPQLKPNPAVTAPAHFGGMVAR
jgi:hypothetical protein